MSLQEVSQNTDGIKILDGVIINEKGMYEGNYGVVTNFNSFNKSSGEVQEVEVTLLDAQRVCVAVQNLIPA